MANVHQFPKNPEHPGSGQALPPARSDEALALHFANLHKDDLRYVAAWRSWLKWDGTRWVKDSTLQSRNLARALCRAASSECSDLPIGMKIASAKTIAAVEQLAKADEHLAATADQWDSDRWLLNTPAGTVDLRTGATTPHKPADYCTKITAAAPDGACPLWMSFLTKIFDGDAELIAFVKRMAGYALTGSTQEHALFFLYGTGANGKSVFLTTLSGVLGDYALTAPIETFTANNRDGHPTDLAMLLGARLVTATETEEGRRWAEAKIKQITGGDRISARFMRQDFFQFTPQFKLLVAGNHKPSLRCVDEAIRRRLHLVPFGVTIPKADRDRTLSDKLKKEWPGILAWAIEGCLQWQKLGLKAPQAVLQATAQYFEAEDTFALWLEECCEKKPDAWEGSSALFASWKEWASSRGEFIGTSKRLAQSLEAKGFEKQRKNKARGFAGIRLIETEGASLSFGGTNAGTWHSPTD
jgi:putative DNA primase/helicase